ncbi:hypothetical protein PsAD26_03342 [Pseudovibrio sp. Ad26]|nr:hypothetical protein PsAD26_03342 [Pseudovibrio sp. Ad26]
MGGFRPLGELDASCFGEVRLMHPDEDWPIYREKPLWPLCQLNLSAAPYRPSNLEDIALITVFISESYMDMASNVVDCTDVSPYAGWFLRAYKETGDLVPVTPPTHKSLLRPFEARWDSRVYEDYPTHDTLPIDFDELGLGDYYEQSGVGTLDATKLGGWPSCIQSEPWWYFDEEDQKFEYALQIGSEDKAGWMWGDTGSGFIARSKTNPNYWALDFQFY